MPSVVRDSGHVVARLSKSVDDGAADESARSRHKYPHGY
jgi:hypothetical protein